MLIGDHLRIDCFCNLRFFRDSDGAGTLDKTFLNGQSLKVGAAGNLSGHTKPLDSLPGYVNFTR